jgi:hypothetical protein
VGSVGIRIVHNALDEEIQLLGADHDVKTVGAASSVRSAQQRILAREPPSQ